MTVIVAVLLEKDIVVKSIADTYIVLLLIPISKTQTSSIGVTGGRKTYNVIGLP